MAQRILVVDDENDVQLVIKTALQSEGFDVATASNGPDALAEVANRQPDLIVLDVMMPGMTGFQVLEKLKSNEKTARIPVIMLTGVSERSKIQEALASGTDYYIVKPFEFHDLIGKVNSALAAPLEDPFTI
ncbi:MAG: Response regulator PleD [candidate division BRC1 bacterium ADurb.BinA364]|nr:MAG: Response regulator PleD [candidate division BRC1 bacterium ADurb.BinA364]